MHVLQLLVHCSICTHIQLPLRSSGKKRKKAILPTQGQSAVSSAGKLSYKESYCELQQLTSLMENSCIKFCTTAFVIDTSTASAVEEQSHQRCMH